jgi:STE24 endopeptidase
VSDRTAAALTLLGVVAVAAGVAALVVRRSGDLGLSRAQARARGAELLPVEPAVRARHAAFHRALRPWTYTSLVVGVVVPLVYGLTPVGAVLVDRLTAGPVPVRAALGGLVLGALAELLGLPFALRREIVLRRYGLSVRSWRSWLADAAKSAVLGAVLSAAALAALYGLLGAAPRWWWAWAAPGAAAVVVLLAFVFPVLVEPLFLRFAPMEPSPLRDRLLALAERGRVPVRDVLVADASRRTTALNAYVSGFGATRRIVVFDTLVTGAPAAEVEVVVAHELGHAARRDVVGGTALAALGAAALCCLLHLVLTSPPVLRAADASGPADPRTVGVLFAVLAVAGLLLGPAQNALSRRIESRADEFALGLSRRPGVFAAMQRRLALTNLADLDPGPVPYLLFASHPTTVQRIAAAHAFAADHPDEPGNTPEATA